MKTSFFAHNSVYFDKSQTQTTLYGYSIGWAPDWKFTADVLFLCSFLSTVTPRTRVCHQTFHAWLTLGLVPVCARPLAVETSGPLAGGGSLDVLPGLGSLVTPAAPQLHCGLSSRLTRSHVFPGPGHLGVAHLSPEAGTGSTLSFE